MNRQAIAVIAALLGVSLMAGVIGCRPEQHSPSPKKKENVVPSFNTEQLRIIDVAKDAAKSRGAPVDRVKPTACYLQEGVWHVVFWGDALAPNQIGGDGFKVSIDEKTRKLVAFGYYQ